MEVLKFYVSEETAEKFRETALKKYKFKKGALSKAAEIALSMWIKTREEETIEAKDEG